MGLEVVVNEILARGAEEEQKILQAAQDEARRLVEAAEGEADELRAQRLQEMRTQIEALRREARSSAEFEVRRRLLTTQRELAEDFRRRVLEALQNLPKADTERLLTALLKEAQHALPAGRLHAPKGVLAWASQASKYEPGRELAALGGFQVESPDGTVLLDYRYETLLENAWKSILSESRSLFEG